MSEVRAPENARLLEMPKLFAREQLPNLIKTCAPYLFLFIIFSAAYASLAPNIFQQDWDSLMYAYWAEKKGIISIWGNHPLSHAILNSIYVMASNFGYHGKALPIFIICNSMIGGSTVALFLSLMKLIKIDHWLSLGYAIMFGATYGLWHYSGSADVYNLSILLVLLAWIFLIYEVLIRKKRYPYISGVLAGLSVLSHQLNATFFLAAFIVILSQKRDRGARMMTFYIVASVLAVVGLLFFGYIAISSFSVPAIYDWIRGYIGDPIYGNYLKLENIPVAWKTALGTFLVPTDGRARFIRITIYSFLFAAVLLGTTQVGLLSQQKRIIFLSAFIQCLVSWFLILWFEPWYPKFWLLTLAPVMIVLVCCIDAVEKRMALCSHNLWDPQKYYPLLLVIIGLIIGIFNLRYAILNEHNTDEISQKSMDIWLKNSNPGDMLITAGDLIPQLWFWSNRPNTIHLYHYLEPNRDSSDRFKYLRDHIDLVLCDGNAVIFAPAIVENFNEPFLLWLDLSREDLRTFFEAYPREEYFTYRNLDNGKETRVFRLLKPNACLN